MTVATFTDDTTLLALGTNLGESTNKLQQARLPLDREVEN